MFNYPLRGAPLLKRTFVFITVMLAVSYGVAAHAQAAATVGLAANPATVIKDSGTNVVVTVLMNTGGASVTTFSLNVEYPDNLLQYVSHALPSGITALPGSTGGSGLVKLNAYTLAPINSANATVATITFRPRSTIGAASIRPISPSNNASVVYTNQQPPVQIYSQTGSTGASVTVSDTYKPGDFNKDGYVNSEDARQFGIQYRAKNISADMDGNGRIEPNDARIFGIYYRANRGR